jgi:hypothetical protein
MLQFHFQSSSFFRISNEHSNLISEKRNLLAKPTFRQGKLCWCGGEWLSIYRIIPTGHSFDNQDVVILDKEEWLFERGVKEVIYELLESSFSDMGL